MTELRNLKDPLIEIAAGRVPGYSIVKALGECVDMAASTTGVDIWRGNQLTPSIPTASHEMIPTPADVGEQMTVVSESVNDTAGGTGIREVRMNYIEASGAMATEDIVMAGTTPVNTVATDIRFVNDLHAIDLGSNGVAEDHIKIYRAGESLRVYSMIAEGGNRSMVPLRMVPVGYRMVLWDWHTEEARDKRCALRIRSTDMDGVLLPGVFCFKGVAYMKKNASGMLSLGEDIPPLSIVKVSAWPDQVDSEASCAWRGILIAD